MAFDLKSLRRGKSADPPRVVVYGEHKIGKSTFAASAPNPVFICTEDGLGAIDTTSFPLAQSYGDVLSAITTLYEEPHDFQTVVVDSLDWLEPMIWRYVAEQHGKDDIEAFGYGKGYVYAADVFREFLAGLNALRDRGMTVICLAHCEIKTVNDPTAESYDRFQIKLDKRASAVVQEWADVIGFAAEKIVIRKEDAGFGKKIKRGMGTGERLLHVTPSPAYVAGNRYGMDDIPLNWSSFVDAMSN